MEIEFWRVKGYTGTRLTKEKLRNENYSFDEIKSVEKNIVKQIEENLENGGVVFGLSKNKIIKAIYFFKLTTNGKEKTLIFDKKVILDEVNKCVKEFENDIDNVLNNLLVNRTDIDKAVWRDKEINRKQKFKSQISNVKMFTWLGLVILCMLSLTRVILSTTFSFGISEYTIDEIKKDEVIIDHVSELNDYDYSEVIDVISEIDNKNEFLATKIILPTAFILFGYIFLIIALKKILDLTKNVTDTESLFTSDKNQLLQKIVLLTYIALLFLLRNIVLWLGIGLVLEIIAYIFNYCVQLTNNQK